MVIFSLGENVQLCSGVGFSLQKESETVGFISYENQKCGPDDGLALTMAFIRHEALLGPGVDLSTAPPGASSGPQSGQP